MAKKLTVEEIKEFFYNVEHIEFITSNKGFSLLKSAFENGDRSEETIAAIRAAIKAAAAYSVSELSKDVFSTKEEVEEEIKDVRKSEKAALKFLSRMHKYGWETDADEKARRESSTL